MASFTSKANGNWSASGQTTWNEVGVPGAGDTASIAHAVTITADTTIGDGTASTVLTIGTSGVGSLTITGAKLTIRGNSSIGYHDGTLTAHPKLTIQHSGGTAAGIEFDGNSGVAPVMTIEDNVLVTITGTSGARCFIRTKSGTAGLPGSIAGNGANYFPFNMIVAYCDFARLGSSTVYGISAPAVSSSITSPSDSPFTWDQFTVDSCGVCPYVGVQGATANFQLTNGTWTNSVGAISGTPACIGISTDGTILTTGTRLINNCLFFNKPYFLNSGNLTTTSNYFGDYIQGNSSSSTCTLFDGNFMYRAAGSSVLETESTGGLSNCYFYNENTGVNNTTLINCGNSTTAGATINILANVFEQAATITSPPIAGIGNGEENSVQITFNFKYNIFIWSGSGTTLSPAIAANSANIGITTLTNYEHNTIVTNGTGPLGQPNGGGVFAADGSLALKANCITSLKANVLVNLGSSTGIYVYANTLNTPARSDNALDSMPASVVGANCYKGFDSAPAGFWAGIASIGTAQDSTPYLSPMSGSTKPGTFTGIIDLAANTDPGFADTTRTLATWSVHKGYASSGDPYSTKIAAALTAIQANTSLTKTDLLPWVRAGYVPMNSALEAASYTGDTSTTDANGNPWLGAGPGIGAMSLASTAAFTLTAPGTAKGDCTVASGNFTVTPLAPQTVIVTPTDGGMGGTFTPTTLSWTSSATAKTFTYTPALIGNHSIAITNNASLGNPAPVSYLGMVALGRSGTNSSGNFSPSLGGQDLFANGTWLPEYKRDITGDPVAPDSADFLAVLGAINLHVDFSATGAGGGNGLYGIPYNVVPGTQTPLAITFTVYPSAVPPTSTDPSDPGPVPINPAGSFEGYYNGTTPPANDTSGADQHCITLVRNETTGLVDTIWESETTWTTDSGATFMAHGGCTFDIATGAQRPDDVSTAEAGGQIIMPTLIRYDEVALVLAGLKPDLGHAIRMTLKFCRNLYSWPGRCTVNTGSAPYPPMGGRMRLSATWYASNSATYSGQAAVLLFAMRKYGIVLSDITGSDPRPFIEGVTDDRWDADATTHGIYALNNVPVSAFEVIQNTPGWTLTGPSSGPIGVAQTFTVTRNPAGAANYDANIYLFSDAIHSTNAGWSVLSIPLTDITPTGTATFTPASGGTYTLSSAPGGQEWYPPPDITFAAGTVVSTPVPAGALIGL